MHHMLSVPEPYVWLFALYMPARQQRTGSSLTGQLQPYQQHQVSATLNAIYEQFLRELSMQRDNPSTTGIRHNNYSSSLTAESPLHVIDLFCGCGGFSLGLARAGFRI